MDDLNRIKRWINVLLSEVSNLDCDQGLEMLHVCGRDCSKANALIEGAVDTKKNFPDHGDMETRFQAFKNTYCNSFKLTKNGDKITLIFEECTCPLVKIGVSNSYLCNCTIGYSMQIFETLFERPVEINLLKSVLNGDSICEQEILLKDI